MDSRPSKKYVEAEDDVDSDEDSAEEGTLRIPTEDEDDEDSREESAGRPTTAASLPSSPRAEKKEDTKYFNDLVSRLKRL